MNKMTRKQASIVFKARTRMTKVKGNYKNGNPDQKCRACKVSNETQKHVLEECPVLHPNGPPKESHMNPFSQNINVLKETARSIEKIMEEIEKVSKI